MITIYSKPNCPYCVRAKLLMEVKRIPFREIHVDIGQPHEAGNMYINRDDLKAVFPEVRTLPLILDGDSKIGGFTELQEYLKKPETA